MIVQFGEWLPDYPDLNNPGSTTALNVLPGAGNYLPFQESVIYSVDTIDNRCQGAYAVKNREGLVFNFSGDANKLYLLQSSSFSDVSRSATSTASAYSTTDANFWSFARFGEEVYASNFDDTMQSINLVSGSFFADVAGDAPRARSIASIKDFLVALNTFDADGEIPYRVRWSAIGDPTSWTVSSITQADFQDLDAGSGDGMQIIGGEYGVILMENAIYRMDYVGSPNIFQFRQVEFARGTPAPKSAVRVGNMVAYLGQDGFYMFDGNSSIPIGANKVDKFFFNDIDRQNIRKVVACVEPSRQLIYWIYPDNDSIGAAPNKALVYNYSQNSTLRWSQIRFDSLTWDGVDYIYVFLSEGYRMIDLDAPYGRMIDIPHRMNSRIFMGGEEILASFNSDKFLSTYDGEDIDATIDTLEAQPNESGMSEITVVRPLIDSTTSLITVQSGHREKQGQQLTWNNPVDINESGEVPVRVHDRYVRFRTNISGGFTKAIGVDVTLKRSAGRR